MGRFFLKKCVLEGVHIMPANLSLSLSYEGKFPYRQFSHVKNVPRCTGIARWMVAWVAPAAESSLARWSLPVRFQLARSGELGWGC